LLRLSKHYFPIF